MRIRFVVALLVAVTAWALQWVPGARADVLLGLFNFDSTKFGNSLTQSDGGTHATSHWLNVGEGDPGSPGYLTGAHFDTGIANIGDGGTVSYTIGYTTPIVNEPGDDFGVVVARFLDVSGSPVPGDSLLVAVSTLGDDGFTADIPLLPDSGVGTPGGNSYFYGANPGSGPFDAQLFVHSLDLADFGLAPGAAVDAIRVTGPDGEELDLIRVAGFHNEMTNDVPEPVTLVLLGIGLSCAASARRLRA